MPNTTVNKSLWTPGYELPVIALTGDYGSGKSSFAYLISPEPDTVLVFDLEAGNIQLAQQFKADRIDLLTHMQSIKDEKRFSLFLEFQKMVEELPTGKYRVISVDTISKIEESIKAHVDAFPGQYGLTPGQLAKSSGLAWGAVKRTWERLLGILTTKCETVVLISHLRALYKDNAPVPGQKEPRGLETIDQLASLFLWMYRDPNKKVQVNGKLVPLCPKYPMPSAVVRKTRISRIRFDKVDEYGNPVIEPLLPQRLPVATPGAIRNYTAAPLGELTDDEKVDYVPDAELSPEEKQAVEEDRKLKLAEHKAEDDLAHAKRTLIKEMQAQFPDVFPTGDKIANALGQLELTFTIASQLSDITAALTQYAQMAVAHGG